MLTFAKGIGNGLAIGGVVASAGLMDSLKANSLSTFGGNPLATAGALANLEYMIDNDLQTNALKVGNMLKDGLHHIADGVPEILEVRGKGLMLGVEFGDPATGAPDRDLTNAVMEEARAEGLLVGKGGIFGNSLRIAPALSITEEEAEEGLDMLRTAIHRARGTQEG
jgi:4-aminobutyrate aminotransferase